MVKTLDFTGFRVNMPTEFKKARKNNKKIVRKEVKESWKKKQQ